MATPVNTPVDTVRASTGMGLSGQRAAFEMPCEVAYFNTANLSPLLHSVRVAGEEALQRRARPWTITAQDWFADVERLRSLFAALIGSCADGVALIPATSYGFAVAANNIALRAGQRVLVLAEDYPSGVYTWQAATRAAGAEMLTVHRAPGQSWTEAVLDGLDERVAVVSVPQVHWTDGALVDVVAVGARAREVGACLVIDGSQSIGALPFDVAAIRPDYVVSVGYKWLLGPFGVGYLYVAEEHRSGRPIEHNWILRDGAEDFARLVDYRDEYQPGARRFDVGERTKFELLPMAVAALEQLHAWGIDEVVAALSAITGQIATRVSKLGLDPSSTDQRGGHMLGVALPDTILADVLPALAAADCYASVRGRSLRLAPHLHVTDADIDQLLDALARIVR
ncbi:Selenocysteine lyase/Cysteine desulfurase [Prauserella flava]|nr:Selenocysteine lyase/Cysteine desulfurase [Prauserella flava]MCR3734443.1 Selenocysteine lyase/Cysteine desulfurase [Prauserella salsuginis]